MISNKNQPPHSLIVIYPHCTSIVVVRGICDCLGRRYAEKMGDVVIATREGERGNLVPRTNSSFKMAGRRNPWPRLLKYSNKGGVFCHVTHNESGFYGGCFQRLVAFFVFCNLKPLFKRSEDISLCLRDKILTNFWGQFGSIGRGFLRPAILNEEKALGGEGGG